MATEIKVNEHDLVTPAAAVISPQVLLFTCTFQGVPGEAGASGTTGPRVSHQTPLHFTSLSSPLRGLLLIVILSPFRESVVSLEREEPPVPRVCRVLEVFLELRELMDLR